jgi:hypothetical protein
VALQGTLDTFALADVLRLLATTAKTGRLRVDGDRGEGSVWLRDGTVMAASAERAIDDAPSEEVVFELLRFEEGSFSFEIDELSPNGEQPEDVEVLLRDANALLSEWKELEQVVPSLDHQVTLVGNLKDGEVTITADHWPTVVAIGEGRSVRALANTLHLGELGVTRAVRDLVDLGIVTIDEPRDDAVPPAPALDEPTPAPMPVADGRPSSRLSRSAPGLAATAAARAEVPRVDIPRVELRPVDPPRNEPPRRGPFSSLGSGESLGTPEAALDPESTGELARLGWLQSADPASDADAKVVEPLAGDPLASPSLGSNGTPAPVAPLPTPADNPRLPREPSKRASRANGSAKRPGANGRSSKRATAANASGPLDDESPTTPTTPSNGNGNGAGAGRMGKGRTGARRTPRPPMTPSPGVPSAPSLGGPSVGGPGISPRFDTGGQALPSSLYDKGPLGPSSLPTDTGQIRPVSPSALPPDLHWAADDAPLGRGLNGLNAGGPAVPPAAPVDPSKVAPHVAAMSPEARAAVQGSVGNAGGANGGPAVGDDLPDRGQLLNFLSSVRP